MTIEEIQKSTEFQVFDRKSARIDAKAMAITIIAFSNEDGGQIALGVEDDVTLTGVDRMFREMAEAGLPAPEYRQNEFMVYATIRQAKDAAGQRAPGGAVRGNGPYVLGADGSGRLVRGTGVVLEGGYRPCSADCFCGRDGCD